MGLFKQTENASSTAHTPSIFVFVRQIFGGGPRPSPEISNSTHETKSAPASYSSCRDQCQTGQRTHPSVWNTIGMEPLESPRRGVNMMVPSDMYADEAISPTRADAKVFWELRARERASACGAELCGLVSTSF